MSFEFALRFWAQLAPWKNVIWQVSNLGFGGVLVIGLWIFLGRIWGPDVFGRFSFIYAFASLYGIFSDIGSDLLAARITAQKQAVPRSLVRLKLSILVVNFILFMLAGVFLGVEIYPLFFFLLGVLALSACSFLNGILRGSHRLDIEARLGIVQKLLFVSMVFFVCIFDRIGILAVSLIYFFTQWLCLFFTVLSVRRYLDISKTAFSVFPLLRALSALWLITLWNMIYFRLDFFIIERFLGNQALGYFSMPFKIWEGCLLVVSAYIAAVFPRLTENSQKGTVLSAMFRRSLFILVSGGVVLGVVLACSGGYAFGLFFDHSYGQSVSVIHTLFPLMPLSYISAYLGIFLVALSQEKTYAVFLTIGFLVHLIVDLFFVRKLGISGAVLGNWIREIFLVVCLLISVTSEIRRIQEKERF